MLHPFSGAPIWPKYGCFSRPDRRCHAVIKSHHAYARASRLQCRLKTIQQVGSTQALTANADHDYGLIGKQWH